ncbi:MAG: cell division protein FtsW [Candidatus Aminicenantes bacterium]|nr:cell division protein FtsW [Candidatus Aminicenantes bacterium]
METFRPYSFDKPLFFTTVVLIVLGALMVMSASGVFAEQTYQKKLFFFSQQVIGAVAVTALVMILLRIRKPFYKSPVFIFALLGLTLVMLLVVLVLPPVAKTNRWLVLGGFRFQPSELAKISLVLFLAWFLDKKRDRIGELKVLLLPLGIVALFSALIIREPDFGTGVLVLAICLVVLFLGGVRLKHFAWISLAVIPPLAVFLISAPYRINRIMAFFSPQSSLESLNFQVTQSKIAVGSGGLFGVSFGESVQKMFFLPCSHTDFIFAIIGEEFGLLGALIVISLFAVLVWRGILISMKAPDFFSQLAAAGLALFLGFQAMLNITVVLGLAPAKGVPLPLISYGRSSLVCTILAVGLLLHISERHGDKRSAA